MTNQQGPEFMQKKLKVINDSNAKMEFFIENIFYDFTIYAFLEFSTSLNLSSSLSPIIQTI